MVEKDLEPGPATSEIVNTEPYPVGRTSSNVKFPEVVTANRKSLLSGGDITNANINCDIS